MDMSAHCGVQLVLRNSDVVKRFIKRSATKHSAGGAMTLDSRCKHPDVQSQYALDAEQSRACIVLMLSDNAVLVIFCIVSVVIRSGPFGAVLRILNRHRLNGR